MSDVLRIDVSLDGEPVGSIEARMGPVPGSNHRTQMNVTIGDTTGETLTYRHRRLRGLPRDGASDPWLMSYALNVAQSAMAKGWWHRNDRR